MTKETFTRTMDDLDGSEGATTYSFSWDGQEREIDLSDANKMKFDKAIQKFLDASRVKKSAAKVQRGKTVARIDSPTAAEIRAWARDAGIPVNAKGRIHPDVRTQYDATH